MTLWQAIVLGVVQGATEFLPISSSGHLILVPRLLGWADQGLGFDIALHAGTLVALVAYFRRDLADLRRTALALPLVLGTLPVIVAGLALQGSIETSLRDPRLVAVNLIAFGLLLGAADRFGRKRRPLSEASWRDGLWIGAAQALALFPGVSRSGVTLTAGLGRGFERAAAARFAFLLAVPATALAVAKAALDAVVEGGPAGGVGPILAGFVAAAVTGFLVVAWLMRYLSRRGVWIFVVYRVLLGIVLWWVFAPA